jgi:hypothetical protein
MFLSFLFYISTFLGAAATAAHPVYLSVTELHYKPEKQSIEIAMKVFSDDLSTALSAAEGEAIEIGTEREPKEATTIINKYIRQYFSLSANGQKLNYEYIGREIERSDFFALWLYFEVKNVPNLKTLTISNSILFELFSSQNNIISVRQGSQIRRASLVKNKYHTSFDF